MRRATETAKVVMDALEKLTTGKSDNGFVISSDNKKTILTVEKKLLVVPFCREKKNVLGKIGADVLNVCSNQTMSKVGNNNKVCVS